jgi:hypothetical protein
MQAHAHVSPVRAAWRAPFVFLQSQYRRFERSDKSEKSEQIIRPDGTDTRDALAKYSRHWVVTKYGIGFGAASCP